MFPILTVIKKTPNAVHGPNDLALSWTALRHLFYVFIFSYFWSSCILFWRAQLCCIYFLQYETGELRCPSGFSVRSPWFGLHWGRTLGPFHALAIHKTGFVGKAYSLVNSTYKSSTKKYVIPPFPCELALVWNRTAWLSAVPVKEKFKDLGEIVKVFKILKCWAWNSHVTVHSTVFSIFDVKVLYSVYDDFIPKYNQRCPGHRSAWLSAVLERVSCFDSLLSQDKVEMQKSSRIFVEFPIDHANREAIRRLNNVNSFS